MIREIIQPSEKFTIYLISPIRDKVGNCHPFYLHVSELHGAATGFMAVGRCFYWSWRPASMALRRGRRRPESLHKRPSFHTIRCQISHRPGTFLASLHGIFVLAHIAATRALGGWALHLLWPTTCSNTAASPPLAPQSGERWSALGAGGQGCCQPPSSTPQAQKHTGLAAHRESLPAIATGRSNQPA